MAFTTAFWRRVAARLALVAIAFNALAPSIAVAREALLAPSASARLHVAARTAGSPHAKHAAHTTHAERAARLVPEEPSEPPQELGVSNASLSDAPPPCDCFTPGGCVFCPLHTGSFVASRTACGLIFDPEASFEPPTAYVRAAPEHSAWLTPQPRAPPALS